VLTEMRSASLRWKYIRNRGLCRSRYMNGPDDPRTVCCKLSWKKTMDKQEEELGRKEVPCVSGFARSDSYAICWCYCVWWYISAIANISTSRFNEVFHSKQGEGDHW
jgi:hypothetical protein